MTLLIAQSLLILEFLHSTSEVLAAMSAPKKSKVTLHSKVNKFAIEALLSPPSPVTPPPPSPPQIAIAAAFVR